VALHLGERPRFTEALKSLSAAQKTSKGAPAYSRYVNRRLGRYLAALAFTLRLSPNQVTAISAAFTFFGIGLLVSLPPTAAGSIAVTLLLVTGYALDSADGQLARLTGGGSAAGEWLDHVVDAFKDGSIHLAVLVCWWRFYDLEDRWLLVPLVFQVVVTVHFFSTLLIDQLRRARRKDHAVLMSGDGHSSVWYSLAVIPTDFGFLCLVFAVLWLPAIFVAVYTALMAASTLFLVLGLIKWYREVKSWS
jgi:phosphatidylglycerophosphate synthase